MYESIFILLFLTIISSVALFICRPLMDIKVRYRWLLFSFILFVAYQVALNTGKILVPLGEVFPELNWNWSGKIVSTILWILVLIALRKKCVDFKCSDSGFTLVQASGSVKPAILVLLIFNLVNIPLHFLSGDGPNYDSETLLFQATMPGFDEEPMYRGLLLYGLSMGLITRGVNVFGARINTAGVLLCILFGLLHSKQLFVGAWVEAALTFIMTGIYGFVLLWLRERTGSLLFPILAHNSVNLFGQFV